MFNFETAHTYTLAATGIKTRSRSFATRQEANEAMYKLVRKYGLHLRKVYDDKHFKTYIYNDNIRIYINRE